MKVTFHIFHTYEALPMMNTEQAREYKNGIARLYSQRSQSYDDSAWHEEIARKLVDYSNIAVDSQVLDVATGTGMVAFYAATKLGPQGSVIGIDIAEGMIERAKAKLNDKSYPNVRFEVGDGEELAFPPNTFDYIFCGSALIWMTDLNAALSHWRTRLRPNGMVGFHAFSESAFVAGTVAQSVLSNFGISYLMSQPTGTPEKCRALLTDAGYKNIEVIAIEEGKYISLEEAKGSWVSASHPAPGQFPHPLTLMTSEQMTEAHAEFDHKLETLNTPEGIWNDMTTFYVYGKS
jgi:ubiquinone/menaquinone biosynthesis C-methylase UbiE